VVELQYCSWFQIGKAKILKKSVNDKVLVIGAGVTLHEAIAAANELSRVSVNIRVLDPFTVKPLDSEAIIANAKECGGRILTVEDHYPEGVHKQLHSRGFLICNAREIFISVYICLITVMSADLIS